MTPRFQSAVMTAEDWNVWHFLGCTSNDAGLGTIDFYELADRRDADIMRGLGLIWHSPPRKWPSAYMLHQRWAYQGFAVNPEAMPDIYRDVIWG